MSLFGKDKDDPIERRIQEDLRARQQASASSQQAASFTSSLGAHATSSAFMSSLIADANNPASPYFAQRAAAAAAAAVHSPYPHPYAALGQPGVSQVYGQSPSDAVAAQLYARQRVTYGYGYGLPGQHDLYAQHMLDRATAYSNAQQRHAEQVVKASSQPPTPAPVPAPATPISVQKERVATPESDSSEGTDSSESEPSTPAEVISTPTISPAQRSPKKKEPRTPVERKKVLEVTLRREGQHIVSDEGHKWYSCGGVPLGLPDDKYWLSELQVFLRSDFAEAFGATEDDIAAPMHGRNKPIALGQVGIRCIHCKSKLSSRCCKVCALFHEH